MDNIIPYARLLQILKDYVENDAEATELKYVKGILENVCGVTEEEANVLGFGYIFDCDKEKE